MIDISVSLMGFVVGLCIGLTSMGGAALMAPFLILVLGVRPVIAVGTDLVYGAITKAVGARVHWRQGTVDLRVAGRLALGSIPGGLSGVLVVALLHQHALDADVYVKRAVGIVLVVAALVLIVRSLAGWRIKIPDRYLSRLQGSGTPV